MSMLDRQHKHRWPWNNRYMIGAAGFALITTVWGLDVAGWAFLAVSGLWTGFGLGEWLRERERR